MRCPWHHKIGTSFLLLQLAWAAGAAAFELNVSSSPDRTSPSALDSATVAGNIYVFTTPETGVKRVRFYLDNPQMTGSPRQTENTAPFDFAGGAVAAANPFRTTQISEGPHAITAVVDRSDGVTEIVTASFIVDNDQSPPPMPGPPDQVHLAWVEDPSTTLTVVWRTIEASSPSSIDYRLVGAGSWQSETGAPRSSGTSGTLHEATLRSLTPGTAYEYRVIGDGGVWSEVFAARTAPAAGPADFTAVYVADTGLIGRLDGLASGTEQVVSEIAALQPTLVLPGGDYAYYDTDKRYGTLQNTIDAWFNQMQPIAARSPLMPTYGNHEALLGEGFGAWAERFPTPEGFDGRRNYSFDVGDVHFVSIFAVSNGGGLSAGALQWIEQDILAAQAAGQQWIIPYFHVSPFADGTNHSSNLQLRAQLGPLFESLGVKLVLASHDQAYERTYPLVDVPAANTPTSSSRACYTMSDGVTWVKISPGGKLSNINAWFSQFSTVPPPAWTAIRNNAHHHYSRLTVSATGTIQLDTYGVTGDGSPPVVVDSFYYTSGSCPPELRFENPAVTMAAPAGATAAAQMNLTATSGTASYTVADTAPWLTVSPDNAVTPAALTLTADASGLAPGTTHIATVTAAAPGYSGGALQVTLTVGGGEGDHTLVWSPQANRTAAAPLDGAQVGGNVFAFVTPETDVTRVRFFLDDPAMSGVPRHTENSAPYDFAGGSVAVANPFGTSALDDGLHTITAAIDRSTGGATVAQATFTVANDVPALLFAPESVALTVAPGDSAVATVNLGATSGTASYSVSEAAPWLTVSPGAGVTPGGLTLTADASGLEPGTLHTATLTATAQGYTADTLQVTLTVTGGGPVNQPPTAQQQSVSLARDTTVSLMLGFSDTDGPGPYTFTVLDAPANGVVGSDDGDGFVTYTPNGGYTGPDSFTFSVNDGLDDSNEAIVTLAVDPVSANSPPAALNQSVSVLQDAAANITLGVSDADGPGPYTFTLVQGPENGTLGSDDGDELVIFTPDAGYTGTDSFTFRVNDGLNDSNEATVSLSVSSQTTLLLETFDGPDSTTVGSGWVELEGPGTEVGRQGNRLVFISAADAVNRAMVTHAFERTAAGGLVWDFQFDWTRTGSEGTYGLFMQLGDSSLMDSNSADAGVGVNLIWGRLSAHQQLGYRAGGSTSVLAQVSGPTAIRVVVDLGQATYDVLVDGMPVGSVLPLDNAVALDTVRFFTDVLSEKNFAGRAFDNVQVTAE